MERLNDLVFDACVYYLHDLPSRALKGASRRDVKMLLKRYLQEMKAIQKGKQ